MRRIDNNLSLLLGCRTLVEMHLRLSRRRSKVFEVLSMIKKPWRPLPRVSRRMKEDSRAAGGREEHESQHHGNRACRKEDQARAGSQGLGRLELHKEVDECGTCIIL